MSCWRLPTRPSQAILATFEQVNRLAEVPLFHITSSSPEVNVGTRKGDHADLLVISVTVHGLAGDWSIFRPIPFRPRLRVGGEKALDS